jgi:hypothetical protein
MPPSDPTIRAWWPSTRSIDLVEAPIEVAASAVLQEFCRYSTDGVAQLEWHRVRSFHSALEQVEQFANIPTTVLVLPTHSQWSALWYNSFLCDGYDSLCSGLSTNHNLRTIHWASSDVWSVFQSGSTFHQRKPSCRGLAERHVQAAQSDKRWNFYAYGEPLPEEDTETYSAKRKRDRLNEASMTTLLQRLGADPWRESYYALPGVIAAITRPIPEACVVRKPTEVLKP